MSQYNRVSQDDNYDRELERAIAQSLHDNANKNDEQLNTVIAQSLHDVNKNTEIDPELAKALEMSKESEKNKCKGPNCDHLDNSRNVPIMPAILMNAPENKKPTLDDVVLLTNAYHCKKQTKYRNIDLKKMTNVTYLVNELATEIIGMNEIKTKIASLIFYFCRTDMPKNQKDFLHIILSGSPGTGKTTVARILGRILYALDCIKYKKPINDLNKNNKNNIINEEYKFVEVKKQDLVGGYVGQTAIKTQAKVDEALGGVFFFDECYSLNYGGDFAGDDPYGKEAGDCLNENMSNHAGEIVFIFAGYADQIDKRFLTLNEGLPSRIQFRFDILPYKEEQLCEIFISKVKKDKWTLDKSLDKNILLIFFVQNYHHFKNYGRDVEKLVLQAKTDRSDSTAFAKPGTNVINLTLENINNGLKCMLATAADKNNKNNKNDKNVC